MNLKTTINPSEHLKNLARTFVCLALTGGLIAGCKPSSSSSESANSGSGDQQSLAPGECSFVVRSIVTDLAQEIYFAAKHRLPATNVFSVIVAEKGGSSPDEPTFGLQIRLDTNLSVIKFDLPVKAPLWSPGVYHGLAVRLANAVGLAAGHAGRPDTFFLDRMRSLNPDDIARADLSASRKLEHDFSDAELHEEAAAVLGFFAFRDHSGRFFDIRAPLSRLTTHLTMAQLLRNSDSFGVNGQVAEAIMLTLCGDETQAMEELDQIAAKNPGELPIVRALQARNTGDYRPMDNLADISPVEYVELFRARAVSVDPTLAWNKSAKRNLETVDCTRIANELVYSVATGHRLYDYSLPLETRETSLVYYMYFHARQWNFVTALNALPENCLAAEGDRVRVQVVGWGQWAYFEQRHICHTLEQNFYFLESVWGVHDDAVEFNRKNEKWFGGLRLYPFVRRFNATDEASYRKAVDEALQVAADTPQWVPASCWNHLFYKPDNWPVYHSKVDSHLRDWFRDDPLPGTAYDLAARLAHPAMARRPDAVARLERLHEKAPYNDLLIRYLLYLKYKNKPTYDQATRAYEAILPYSVNAMIAVAETVRDKPARYEELMLKAAKLDVNCYYLLSDFEIDQRNEKDAAKYLDLACASDPDSVQVANHALWRVQYYLKNGQSEKARQIADQGGQVYSEIGLQAEAYYFEKTGNDDGAFEWYYKILERYGDSEPLDGFRQRYKSRTGDTRFDSVEDAYARILFPNGRQQVAIKDFTQPPTDGTLINGESGLLRAAGIQPGAVVVALNGIRIDNEAQYTYVRDKVLIGPEMDLIVWQNGGFREIKASPPNHMFDVDIRDYVK